MNHADETTVQVNCMLYCNRRYHCSSVVFASETVSHRLFGVDKRAWLMGACLCVLFYVVASVFFLPGSVLTLGAGFLFGVPVGFRSAWIGATLGACAVFFVGRTLARDWIAAKVAGNSKFAAVDEAVGKEGFKIVFLLRLSPLFPFNFLNYALGLTKVSFKHYALASLIGNDSSRG